MDYEEKDPTVLCGCFTLKEMNHNLLHPKSELCLVTSLQQVSMERARNLISATLARWSTHQQKVMLIFPLDMIRIALYL